MQKISPPRIRKLPRREVAEDSTSVRTNESALSGGADESMHGDVKHDFFSEDEHAAAAGFLEGTSDFALPTESEQQTSSCSCTAEMTQADLDLKRIMEEAKKKNESPAPENLPSEELTADIAKRVIRFVNSYKLLKSTKQLLFLKFY